MGLRRAIAVAVIAAAGSLLFSPPGAALAAASFTFAVNTTADAPDAHPGDGVCATAAGACSLRAAIGEADAQPRGTSIVVSVPAGTYHLLHGTLAIKRNTVSITGASAARTVISGNGRSADLSVSSAATVSLATLELTGGGAGLLSGGGLVNSGATTLSGVTVTANRARSGGGITNQARGTLALNSTTISSNSVPSASFDSAPGGSGGGIMNAGKLTLTSSAVTGNDAGSGTLGAANNGGNGGNGGGIANTGTLVLNSSTVSSNNAGSGGPGEQQAGGSGGSGGGIYSAGGSVTLTASTVSGNMAGYSGANLTGDGTGTAGNGAGVYATGKLSITDSTISANTGASGSGSTNGGGIWTAGTATITGTTFTGNMAGPGSGGASGNGGAIANRGTLSLTNSTLSGNAAGSGAANSGSAGGDGGGLYTSGGSATLTGDEFDSNTSGDGGSGPYVDPGGAPGGAGGIGGAIYAGATLSVTNTTISGNNVGVGGLSSPPAAVYAADGFGAGVAVGAGTTALSYVTIASNADGIYNSAGTVTATGTIVADSTGINDLTGANCTGQLDGSAGHNLDSGTTCGFTQVTDVTSTEPLLGQLTSNGGPTQTLALLAGSPAIDHGGSAATGCPALDQRGLARPDELADGGACDIGAFESQGVG